MKRATHHKRRPGITLLEVMAAVSITATLMASSFVVLRSSHTVWLAHEADSEIASNVAAVLRHVVRHTRQASSVISVTTPTDSSGSLTVLRDDGSTFAWDHSAGGVTLSVDGGAAQPLAEGIDTLSFAGYAADGVTLAASAADVHLLRVEVGATMPSGTSRTVSSYMWVRSW
jgi:type II secretory pathway component PulJ